MADEEFVEASETTKKKASAEDFAMAGEGLLGRGTTSMFLGGEDGDSSDDGHKVFEEALAGKEGKSIMSSCSAVNVRSWDEELKPSSILGKKKRKKDDDTSDDGDDDASGAGEGAARPVAKKAKGAAAALGQEDWFDASIELPKASRTLFGDVTKLQVGTKLASEQASAVLLEWGNESEEVRSVCAFELRLVERRLNATKLVLAAEQTPEEAQTKLDEYIANIPASASAIGSNSSKIVAATGKDDMAIDRCGPCPGYQSLKSFPYMFERAESLKNPSSSNNAHFTTEKMVTEYVKPAPGPWRTVLSCRLAIIQRIKNLQYRTFVVLWRTVLFCNLAIWRVAGAARMVRRFFPARDQSCDRVVQGFEERGGRALQIEDGSCVGRRE